MTTYEQLKQYEKEDKQEIIVKSKDGREYLCNTNDYGDVCLYSIEDNTGNSDMQVTPKEFNDNFSF